MDGRWAKGAWQVLDIERNSLTCWTWLDILSLNVLPLDAIHYLRVCSPYVWHGPDRWQNPHKGFGNSSQNIIMNKKLDLLWRVVLWAASGQTFNHTVIIGLKEERYLHPIQNTLKKNANCGRRNIYREDGRPMINCIQLCQNTVLLLERGRVNYCYHTSQDPSP